MVQLEVGIQSTQLLQEPLRGQTISRGDLDSALNSATRVSSRVREARTTPLRLRLVERVCSISRDITEYNKNKGSQSKDVLIVENAPFHTAIGEHVVAEGAMAPLKEGGEPKRCHRNASHPARRTRK